MARNMAAALLAQLESGHVEPVFFVALELDSGTERLHTGLGTLTWGGNDYFGAGSLANIGGVEEGDDLSPYAIQIGLSGIDSTITNIAFSTEYMQRPCKVYLGALADGALVSDPILLHSGFLVNVDVSIGDENGDEISATSESELQIFERSSAVRYTAGQLQGEYPGDLGLEFIDQIEDAKVVWRGRSGALVGANSGFGARGYDYFPGTM